MFILQPEQVNYCVLSSHAADTTIEMLGLEYQRKLYVKGETYHQRDRQAAIQQARQKLLDMKGSAMILVEEGQTVTLWYHDKTLQKVNSPLAINLQQLVTAMRDVDGLQIKDRRFRLKVYRRCFIGSEAVDWLVTYLNISRAEAVQIGQRLINENWIHHVVDEQPFQDTYFFYRFRWDD